MFFELGRDDTFRIESRRLWLRWPRFADKPALAALAGDGEVARCTANLPHPYRRWDAEDFILRGRADNFRGAALRLVLTLKTGPRKIVGALGVGKANSRATLGFWVGKPFWGQGFASEASAAAIDAFFLAGEADELGALALPDHVAARGALTKLGFVEAERLADGPGRFAGNATLRFALRRRDWEAPGRESLRPGALSDRALQC
jgi:RimJ/RimL family protein N-acetyltransferase